MNKVLFLEIFNTTKLSTKIKLKIDKSCYVTCILTSDYQINIKTEFVCEFENHVIEFDNLYPNTSYKVSFQNFSYKPIIFKTK